MPTSKKPRKKGRHGREADALRKWRREKFASVEDARASLRVLEESRLKRRPGVAQIHFMLQLADKEELLESFTKAYFCLEKWPTTDRFEDFDRVSSSLMLGILCHKRMGVLEHDLLSDMQHAAFMCVVCVRLRNFGKPVPPQNLEAVRRGLTVSQELMEYAYEHDRQAFIDVLKHNDADHVGRTPGLLDQHERLILGQNYDRVQEWEKEDEATWNNGLLHREEPET